MADELWRVGAPQALDSPDRADDRLHSRHDVIHCELTLVALLFCHFLRGALWKVRGSRWWQQKGPLPTPTTTCRTSLRDTDKETEAQKGSRTFLGAQGRPGFFPGCLSQGGKSWLTARLSAL